MLAVLVARAERGCPAGGWKAVAAAQHEHTPGMIPSALAQVYVHSGMPVAPKA